MSIADGLFSGFTKFECFDVNHLLQPSHPLALFPHLLHEYSRDTLHIDSLYTESLGSILGPFVEGHVITEVALDAVLRPIAASEKALKALP